MTQILTKGKAFKDDQYILATQVKQCFYLKDMARRQPHWKVVEHVNHKKFSDGGVIVVEEYPDVIHFDNSYDLPLSTNIIDLDEDDDIIDDEDALLHDLAYSDDEDLVNVDDDGVDMSTHVARGHDGDGGSDDRPPTHHIPTSCGCCFVNRGKGTRKPNLGGRKAGRLHTRLETRNLVLKKITDDKGPVPIQEMPLYYPSWQKVPAERKATIVKKIGTQFDLKPHMQSECCTDINASIEQHLQKLYNTNKQIRMRRLPSRMIPGTKPDPLKITKTGQRARSYAGRDPGHLLAFEIRWLQGLGSNTPLSVPCIKEEINALAQKGKQRGYLPGVGRVFLGWDINVPSPPPSQCTHNSVDYESSPEFGNASGSGGYGDDDMADDEDDGKDEEDEEDGDRMSPEKVSLTSFSFQRPRLVSPATSHPGRLEFVAEDSDPEPLPTHGKFSLLMTTSVRNNLIFRSFFEKQKLTGPNFIDWYRQLRLVLSTEDKENYLEHPIPAAPVTPPGHQVPPEALTAHAAWAMYSKQAEQELLQTVREFHTSKQEEGQSVSSHVLKMKGYIDNLERLGQPVGQNLAGLRGSKKLKPGALSLYVGDGHHAAVEATGTYHLELHSGLVIILNSCHYATSITRGVISVSRLFDNGFINRFDDNNVISVFKNNLVYFMTVPRDGIYEIDMSCSNTNDSSMYAITNKRAKINLDSSLLWHCRLGHISKKRIEKFQHDGLLNSIDIESLEKCVSCISVKMARKPYSHQVEMAKDLLGLIHTDVCGQFKIVSRQGASYFVTFTNDFSRYGYVYLLKHKHEVFESFKVFQKEVENQLGKTIKSLRSDRRGEYMSQEFLDHLKDHGIIAHRTPPYTPQNNRVSERRNRTLLDMVRSMMSQTTLPKSFWDYALETAARILNIVPTKKTDMDGAVYIFKARLVAKGFTQTYGVNYKETFSPVADIRAIRILIAIAAYYDYEIWQMDVKTVFLNGHLSEEVYIEQPEGFVNPKYPNLVCKLKRSIYGLKQASRQWNKRFDDEIKKFGFTQNPDEPCVYLKANVKSYLGRSFAMKYLREAAYIFGIKIYRDRSKRLIGLGQKAYIEKILKRFYMEYSKRRTIPMQEKLKLSKSQGVSTPAEKQRMQNIPYASAVGSIMYDVRCTRPDVAFAQNMTSRFQQNPGKEYWTAVKNNLKYLRNTKDIFLVNGGNMKRELRVSCYTDAGYLTDADNLKLQTGYVFFLNRGAVNWKSTKQSIFATSSTDDEYIAAFDASKEAVWIRKFISGLGIVPTIEEPISMYCDNTGAIAIAKDDGVTKGARHFRAKVHYLRETIKLGDVKIEKIDTDDNLADPFTNALAFPKHSVLTRNIGLLPASSFM
nr:retrotransposon protein, putative, Ty1-copia subclass [Tanacetum cinerariifolium]